MTFSVPPFGTLMRLDKPVGPTSHDMVSRVRRCLGMKRVGHTGTLDPFASGLMVMCIGPATRLSEYLTGLSKSYEATLRLGTETETLDPEGKVVGRDDERWKSVTRLELDAAAGNMVGRIMQTPPAFSAKKVKGERAYMRARRGEVVALTPVEVEIMSFEITRFEAPEVDFSCTTSSGTYVRVLGGDLAESVGTVGHLTALRRTSIGSMTVDGAVPADTLDGWDGIESDAWLGPLTALAHLPRIEVDGREAARLRMGQAVPCGGREDADPVVATEEDRLVAIVRIREGSVWPSKVFPV